MAKVSKNGVHKAASLAVYWLMAGPLVVGPLTACSDNAARSSAPQSSEAKEADAGKSSPSASTSDESGAKSSGPVSYAPTADSGATPPAPAAPSSVGAAKAAPAAAATAKPVQASLGTGGATGQPEVTFSDSTGLKSTYKISVPTDAGPNKAYGLHIHLHGDGGTTYQTFPNSLARSNLMGVVVKAPNKNMTWGRASGVPHAKYLSELIQNEIVKKYNVDLDRIYFSSASGGSYFLAGSFIPAYGNQYHSGAFLMCGGEAPRVDFVSPDILTKFRIHWQVTAGERSDILPSVKASIKAYQTASAGAKAPAGMETSEILGSGGHCEFDGLDYTNGIKAMLDRKFETVLTKP